MLNAVNNVTISVDDTTLRLRHNYDTAYYFILAEFKVNTYSQYTATIVTSVTTTTIHVYQLKKLQKYLPIAQ